MFRTVQRYNKSLNYAQSEAEKHHFTRLVIVFCLVGDGLFSIFGAKLNKQRYEEESNNDDTDVPNGSEWEGPDLWL